ncbi:MAG TPA: hypothetical protein PKG98_02405 [Myxococcota bacterium]|nr:hypothetical protein [Myxococcota bacterium]
MRKTSWLLISIGLLIPVASIVYFGMDLFYVQRAPAAPDWQEAARVVHEGWKEGDLVVFSPQWAQGASPLLKGLKVDTAENPDWYEASKASRVWVIGSMDGFDPEPPDGWKTLSEIAGSKVSVDLWQPPSGRELAYSLLDNIDDAVVSRIHPKRREICSNLKDSRWYCGKVHSWLFVGHSRKDIAGRVRDVVWAHAIDRTVVEAVWPKVPGDGTLTVHWGLTQRAAEAAEGKPTSFKVFLNGKAVLEDTLEVDEHTWHTIDIPIKGTEPSEVKFQISSPGAQSRQVCFTADLWRSKAGTDFL